MDCPNAKTQEPSSSDTSDEFFSAKSSLLSSCDCQDESENNNPLSRLQVSEFTVVKSATEASLSTVSSQQQQQPNIPESADCPTRMASTQKSQNLADLSFFSDISSIGQTTFSEIIDNDVGTSEESSTMSSVTELTKSDLVTSEKSCANVNCDLSANMSFGEMEETSLNKNQQTELTAIIDLSAVSSSCTETQERSIANKNSLQLQEGYTVAHEELGKPKDFKLVDETSTNQEDLNVTEEVDISSVSVPILSQESNISQMDLSELRDGMSELKPVESSVEEENGSTSTQNQDPKEQHEEDEINSAMLRFSFDPESDSSKMSDKNVGGVELDETFYVAPSRSQSVVSHVFSSQTPQIDFNVTNVQEPEIQEPEIIELDDSMDGTGQEPSGRVVSIQESKTTDDTLDDDSDCIIISTPSAQKTIIDLTTPSPDPPITSKRKLPSNEPSNPAAAKKHRSEIGRMDSTSCSGGVHPLVKPAAQRQQTLSHFIIAQPRPPNPQIQPSTSHQVDIQPASTSSRRDVISKEQFQYSVDCPKCETISEILLKRFQNKKSKHSLRCAKCSAKIIIVIDETNLVKCVMLQEYSHMFWDYL